MEAVRPVDLSRWPEGYSKWKRREILPRFQIAEKYFIKESVGWGYFHFLAKKILVFQPSWTHVVAEEHNGEIGRATLLIDSPIIQ